MHRARPLLFAIGVRTPFSHCSSFVVFQFSNVLAYCMSKSAVDQMTRCCALGMSQFHITYWLILVLLLTKG